MGKHILFTTFLLFIFQCSFSQWVQLGNDIDGEAADNHSGRAVSFNSSGTRIAIGAPENNGNGLESGHVRIYEYQGGNWIQLGSDIDGEAAEDRFGRAVSLNASGNRVAVGARYNDANGDNSGHARVYEFNGVNWIQLGADIDGDAPGDSCGQALSLSEDGSRVAVASSWNDGNGINSGQVRIFEFDGVNWIQLGSDIYGEAANDFFGTSVSLGSNGNRLASGASGNDTNGLGTGHTRIYEFNGMDWVQLGADINGEAAGDGSGSRLSLSNDGNRIAIGAVGNSGNGIEAGHVRVFEFDGINWIQLGGDIDGEAAGDWSAWSVSLSGNGIRVAIGAINNAGNGAYSGHARVYEYDGVNWIQSGMDIDGEAAGDLAGFGISLNNNGSMVAVGASHNSDNGNEAGHVRIYADPLLLYTAIPDPNFEQALIDQGIDSEGILDGQVLRWDITWLSTLDVSNLAITDLTGIEDFVYLVNLNCSFNQLTTLDVSNNSNLRRLYCHDNLLNGNMSLRDLNFLVHFNTVNNPGLSCIAIDDAIAANAGTGIYTHWVKDNTTNYAINCNVSLSRDRGSSDIKDTENDLGEEATTVHSVSVYPNPAGDWVHIALPAEETIANVIFYNLQGQQVLTSKSNKINVGSLPESVYFIAIKTSGNKIFYRKILISKQ